MTTYSFKYSVLENSNEPLDYYAPVSFLVWYQQQNYAAQNIDSTFAQYQNYIHAWGKFRKKSKQETVDIVRDSYIQVLREIVVNFSTEEEKRFISNADFTDPLDLDVILPFFIKKIKSICLFYSGQREEVKTAVIQHSLKGSNVGVENLIKKLIFDAATTNQVDYTTYTSSFPPLSTIAAGLSVYVEELYDLNEHYYNLNPLADFKKSYPSDATREALSSANLNTIYPKLYIALREAIVDAIKQYPLFITTLGVNNFTINPVVSGTEFNYLKPRDFITYLSGGEQSLKLNLLKKLAPKYMANDFYYLSTGTTNTSFVSGLLFSVKDQGAPTLNLLNRQFPSTASVTNLDYLFTEYEIGRFFLPQHAGIVVHNTPYKSYAIDIANLMPNTVYAFPDPDVIGNVSYNSQTDNELIPLIYTLDLEWNKRSRSEQFSFGDVLSNSYNQLYYGYQSQSQDQQKDIAGLSKTYDNLQFWEGERQEQWSSPDLWPGLNRVESLPYAQRQDALLVGDLTPVSWGSDIFGNEFGVLKRVNELRSLSAINYDDGGVMPGSSTVGLCAAAISPQSLYAKKNRVPGSLYYKNNYTTLLTQVSSSLSAIFYKYPTHVQQEIYNEVLYFNLYYDTFVIETLNFVIVDSFNYDYASNRVIATNSSGSYFPKYINSRKLEAFAGEWYSEKENALYVAFLRLQPTLSGSNYRILYPEIYKSILSQINFKKVYPEAIIPSFTSNSYSLCAGLISPPQINLNSIDGVSFSKSEKSNLFNFTYLGKNLNRLPFFVNEQLKEGDWDIFLETFNPRLFKPFYFVYDNNYYNPQLPFLVKYNASSSAIVGGHNSRLGTLNYGQPQPLQTTYLYNDGDGTVQINSKGTYIIQFDWESYDLASVFIGCSGYQVKRVDNNLIFNFGTENAVVMSKYDTPVSNLINFSSTYTVLTGVSAITQTAIASANTVAISGFTDYTIVSASQLDVNVFDFSPADYGDYDTFVLVTSGSSTLYTITSSYPSTGGGVILTVAPSAANIGIISNVFAYSDITPLKCTVYCDITRPVYPDPSILKITLTTDPVSADPIFCSTPDSIYNGLYITKTGPGSGLVFTDPSCIVCGDTCYHEFPYNRTITILASADRFSIFNRWIGGPCDGSSNSACTFNITNLESITAQFNALPFFTLTVDSIATNGRTVTNDLKIDCPTVACQADFLVGTNLTLSCLEPLSGWFFQGWRGGPCQDIITDNICSFQISENLTMSAQYIRYHDYNVQVTNMFNVSSLYYGVVDYGVVVARPTWLAPLVVPFSTTGSQSYSGSNEESYSTYLVLSANPTRGYMLSGWYNLPSNAVVDNNLNTASFAVTNDAAISAIFDIGYYTLSLQFSGDGTGFLYNSAYNIFTDNGNAATPSTYQILSGTNLTIYLSAYPQNTVISLSSHTGSLGLAASAIDIRMDTDRTVVATVSTGNFYNLDIIRIDTVCGNISSVPPRLNCGDTGITCAALFAAGTTVTLYLTGESSTCRLSAYVGEGITYYYRGGTGINFNPNIIDSFTLGDTLGSIDPSILLDPAGAPYIGGEGINITNGDVTVSMTTNRIVSASFYTSS